MTIEWSKLMNTTQLAPFPSIDTIPLKQKIETRCPFRNSNEKNNFVAPICLKSVCGLWDSTIDQCVFMNLSKVSFH